MAVSYERGTPVAKHRVGMDAQRPGRPYSTRVVLEVRVGWEDGKLRSWHYIYVGIFESRLIRRVINEPQRWPATDLRQATPSTPSTCSRSPREREREWISSPYLNH